MNRLIASCSLVAAPALLLTLLAASAPLAAGSATGVPSMVQRVALGYAAELHGAIGMQRHFSTTIKAGPIRHTETSESGVLFNNGAFVKMKYYSIVDDGKAFSTDKVATRESQANADWAAGKIFFKEPYDRRFFADYGYSPPQACTGCPAGLLVVNFTSAIRDDQHGNGMMWIDSATARVKELIYTPNALPQHATSGSITEFTSNVAPGIWYVTRIDETYQGKVAIIKGTGQFSGSFDRVRRFASAAQGEAALSDGSI
jgi:hypothetical protein